MMERPHSDIIDFVDCSGRLIVYPRKRDPATMSRITIRNLDPDVKERLLLRAAEHGHSMEAEVRIILKMIRKDQPARRNLYERIRARVEPLGGIELELPPRELDRDPPRMAS